MNFPLRQVLNVLVKLKGSQDINKYLHPCSMYLYQTSSDAITGTHPAVPRDIRTVTISSDQGICFSSSASCQQLVARVMECYLMNHKWLVQHTTQYVFQRSSNGGDPICCSRDPPSREMNLTHLSVGTLVIHFPTLLIQQPYSPYFSNT